MAVTQRTQFINLLAVVPASVIRKVNNLICHCETWKVATSNGKTRRTHANNLFMTISANLTASAV